VQFEAELGVEDHVFEGILDDLLIGIMNIQAFPIDIEAIGCQNSQKAVENGQTDEHKKENLSKQDLPCLSNR
jgi:hypothetical protein